MPVSYFDALRVIEHVAARRLLPAETIAIDSAVGRICNEDVRCLDPTPSFDSSAMDGFAVDSSCTVDASEESPILLRVKGTVAAEDPPFCVSTVDFDGIHPCVEIMTGAEFPLSSLGYTFDACVRWEDVTPVTLPDRKGRFITITKPVKHHQNKRLAGSDMLTGDAAVLARSIISPKHVMAMASLGRSVVNVLKKPRVGICCTGSELRAHSSASFEVGKVRDVISPYISALLRSEDVVVDFFGTVADDADEFAQTILCKSGDHAYDLIITTGAVSHGKFDIVREGLERLHAEILFHHVAIRPGHPVLFASLPLHLRCSQDCDAENEKVSQVPVFGLPGNPMASAACLRFFVLPYLRLLRAQPREIGFTASLTSLKDDKLDGVLNTCASNVLLNSGTPLDCFRHGIWWEDKEIGQKKVALLSDQSPAKIKPALQANCWVWIPPHDKSLIAGELLQCFSTD